MNGAYLHDSLAAHRPRGAAWPADARWPPYADGAPPAVAAGLHRYDSPPRASGTALDTGWTPSSWAVAPDPAPYAMAVGGTRYTHHAEGDSIYTYKRLAYSSSAAAVGAAAACDGVNPYDDNAAFLRAFHGWAAEQAARGAAGGIEHFAYPDRWPGMTTAMARTSPLVPRFAEYGAAAAPPTVTPPAWAPLTSPLSPPVPPPADWPRGHDGPPPDTLPPSWPRGPVSAAPVLSAGYLGARRVQGGGAHAYHRADWAAPAAHATRPAQLFH